MQLPLCILVLDGEPFFDDFGTLMQCFQIYSIDGELIGVCLLKVSVIDAA